MKYISLLVVIVFIVLTFWFSKKTEDLSIDQMNRMNKMITNYMIQVLEEKHPQAVDIEFSKIYNEVIEKGKKMKAHFKFSYKEPGEQEDLEKVYRKGSFLITSQDGKKWTAKIENAGDVKVEFMEPFSINSNGGGDNDGIDKTVESGKKEEVQGEGSKPEADDDLEDEDKGSKNSQTSDNDNKKNGREEGNPQ